MWFTILIQTFKDPVISLLVRLHFNYLYLSPERISPNSGRWIVWFSFVPKWTLFQTDLVIKWFFKGFDKRFPDFHQEKYITMVYEKSVVNAIGELPIRTGFMDKDTKTWTGYNLQRQARYLNSSPNVCSPFICVRKNWPLAVCIDWYIQLVKNRNGWKSMIWDSLRGLL